jgi:hypothetical protein
MIARAALLSTVFALCACGQPAPARKSLIGDHPAPKNYALAGDTITLWQRRQQPNGGSRLHAYAIAPGGAVEHLDEVERGDAPTNPEDAPAAAETRLAFTLSPAALEKIRFDAARLRPTAMGPGDPVGGYAGEARPLGCPADASQPRAAGVNFLNGANWGAFVLDPACTSDAGRDAADTVTRLFDQLEAEAQRARQH